MPVLGSRGGASISGFGGLAKLGYFLRNSLRFRSSASGRLSRTPSGAGNRKTYTISVWCKRGLISDTGTILAAKSGSPWTVLAFSNGDGVAGTSSSCLQFSVTAGSSPGVYTTAIFRDPSAWYHIVCAVDTTQATASNRVKIYINGTQQTLISGNYPTQNQDTQINNTVAHDIGNPSSYTHESDFYLSEFNLIDGQQLTPSSFAKTDASTGQWIPIKYSGTYGTNGFYLNFNDASAATAAAIGKDSSGNGNNWTPNNISVTSGTTYDSMTDVPTLSGSASNYATWNPLVGSAGRTYSDGNLKYSYANNWQKPTYSTIGTTTIPIYCELTNQTTNVTEFAVVDSAFAAAFNGADTTNGSTTNTLRVSTNAVTFYAAVGDTASIYKNGSTVATGLTTAGNNDVIMMAFDPTTGKIWFGVNGTWHNSGNPAAGTNPSYTWSGGTGPYFVAVGEENGGAATINFGQRPFSYTAPAGFKSLNTYNIL